MKQRYEFSSSVKGSLSLLLKDPKVITLKHCKEPTQYNISGVHLCVCICDIGSWVPT